MLNKFGFEYLFSYYANIGDFYRMPKSPFGLRHIGYITDGRVWGDKVNGELAPGGGDWCVVRTDGVSMPDVRTMIRTDDGAEIYMHYTGKMDTGKGGFENYCKGIFPDINYIYTSVEFETEAENYLWLNRCQCFGVGIVDRTKTPLMVQYDVYALTGPKID